MLVIGPSLPVVQYLWLIPRSSQPLLSTDSSASESLLQTLSPCPHGAMKQCTCFCALGVGTSGYHPIGIRPRHIEMIFAMFKGLHPRDNYGGGTGAGLTIAKKIIEYHSGTLWVESIYGVSSIFYFTMPGSVRRYGGECQPGDSPDRRQY